jgi:hypothetical protein
MNQNEFDMARNLCSGMEENKYSVGEIAQHARRLMPVMLAEIDRLQYAAEYVDIDRSMSAELLEKDKEIDRLNEQLTGAGIMIDVKQAEIERLTKKLALAEAWLAGMNSAWSKEDEYWDSVK